MVRLVQLTEGEFDRWLEKSIRIYAGEHVKAGNWKPESALQLSKQTFDKLLPDGLKSKDQFLCTIVDDTNATKVGMTWFGVRDLGQGAHAFIWDFEIYEAFRRRGYASQALQAVEETIKRLGHDKISLHVFGHNHAAIALYQKMGYQATDIIMSKVLDARE